MRTEMSEPHAASPWRGLRLWAAFAVLPIMNTLIGYGLGYYMGQRQHGTGVAGQFAFFAGFFSFGVTFVGAFPVVFSLMQRGPVSLKQLLTAGALLGNAPFLVYMLGLVLPFTVAHLIAGTLSEHLAPLPGLITDALRVVAGGSILGAWSAFVFWFIGIRRL
jgi:hypothetical protein